MIKKNICPKCGSDNTVWMSEKQRGMTPTEEKAIDVAMDQVRRLLWA